MASKDTKSMNPLSGHNLAILRKVLEFFSVKQEEEKEISERFGIGQVLDCSEKNTFRYMSAPRPKRQLFQAYLESLNDQDLTMVMTIMYAGREFLTSRTVDSYENMFSIFIRENHKEGKVQSIIEKAPLDRYLEAGISAYSTPR